MNAKNTSTYYEYNTHVFHFNLHVISTEALHLGLRSAERVSESPQGESAYSASLSRLEPTAEGEKQLQKAYPSHTHKHKARRTF